MLSLLRKLENPKQPLLGPNVKALKFWGLLLPENSFKKAFYMFMHFAVTIFTATEYIDVWFVKNDMELLLTNLKITMLATVSVCKVSTFLAWQIYWKQIISYVVKGDIYQRNTEDVEKLEMIKKVTKYCRKITYSYWFLMYTTVVIVMFQPMFKYFSSETYRENVKSGNDTYLQVVSSWVPFNKNTIPGYLVASIYQTYAAVYGGGWITSFDTNAIVIMVFFKLELELLRVDCRQIFGEEKALISDYEVKRRLMRCHKRHVELINKRVYGPLDGKWLPTPMDVCNTTGITTVLPTSKEFHDAFMKNFLIVVLWVNLSWELIPDPYARLFDSCLSPIMLLYMFVCSVMLCVTAYQINIETNPMQKFLMTEYLIFGVAQLFIYCWHSNDVFYESESLIYGPYESVWWCKNVKYRKDLLLLTGQFKKTVVFSAGPFTKLTVTTFITILKGAYSYYTLLNQSQMK